MYEEIHNQVGTWFKDAEIYQWIGENFIRLEKIESQVYVRASEDKRAGTDWRQAILDGCCRNELVGVVESLMQLPLPAEERVNRFVQETGAVRSTYFRIQKKLKES